MGRNRKPKPLSLSLTYTEKSFLYCIVYKGTRPFHLKTDTKISSKTVNPLEKCLQCHHLVMVRFPNYERYVRLVLPLHVPLITCSIFEYMHDNFILKSKSHFTLFTNECILLGITFLGCAFHCFNLSKLKFHYSSPGPPPPPTSLCFCVILLFSLPDRKTNKK